MSAPFHLDADVAIYILSGDPIAQRWWAQQSAMTIAISAIAFSQIDAGTPSAAAHPQRQRLEQFRAFVNVLPFEEEDARRYGDIVRAVGFSRRKSYDRMIAAQALNHGAALVTNNIADFADIPGLTLENWRA